MGRTTFQTSSLRLGFDDIAQLMEALSRQSGSAGYPPYNITHVTEASEDGGHILRVTLAVAGFSADDLDIVVEGQTLTISGRQSEPQDAEYLHRGIAARPFRRVFSLSASLNIMDAHLENGLLSIDLCQPDADTAARRIVVKRR